MPSNRDQQKPDMPQGRSAASRHNLRPRPLAARSNQPTTVHDAIDSRHDDEDDRNSLNTMRVAEPAEPSLATLRASSKSTLAEPAELSAATPRSPSNPAEPNSLVELPKPVGIRRTSISRSAEENKELVGQKRHAGDSDVSEMAISDGDYHPRGQEASHGGLGVRRQLRNLFIIALCAWLLSHLLLGFHRWFLTPHSNLPDSDIKEEIFPVREAIASVLDCYVQVLEELQPFPFPSARDSPVLIGQFPATKDPGPNDDQSAQRDARQEEERAREDEDAFHKFIVPFFMVCARATSWIPYDYPDVSAELYKQLCPQTRKMISQSSVDLRVIRLLFNEFWLKHLEIGLRSFHLTKLVPASHPSAQSETLAKYLFYWLRLPSPHLNGIPSFVRLWRAENMTTKLRECASSLQKTTTAASLLVNRIAALAEHIKKDSGNRTDENAGLKREYSLKFLADIEPSQRSLAGWEKMTRKVSRAAELADVVQQKLDYLRPFFNQIAEGGEVVAHPLHLADDPLLLRRCSSSWRKYTPCVTCYPRDEDGNKSRFLPHLLDSPPCPLPPDNEQVLHGEPNADCHGTPSSSARPRSGPETQSKKGTAKGTAKVRYSLPSPIDLQADLYFLQWSIESYNEEMRKRLDKWRAEGVNMPSERTNRTTEGGGSATKEQRSSWWDRAKSWLRGEETP